MSQSQFLLESNWTVGDKSAMKLLPTNVLQSSRSGTSLRRGCSVGGTSSALSRSSVSAPTRGPVSLLDVRHAGREYTLPYPRKAFKSDVLDLLENQVT